MDRRRRREIVRNIKVHLPQRRAKLSFRKRRNKFNPKILLSILLWIVELAAVIALAYAINVNFCVRLTCSGESMEDTIPENADVWVDVFSYSITEPKVGDVIAFLPSGNIMASYSIKRIVAVPGDTVLISDGVLYVNGEAVELEDSSAVINVAGRAEEAITLGEDEYFVLGDNINYSEDSRYSSVANVKAEHIYGKVWFIPQAESFGLVN